MKHKLYKINLILLTVL